MKLNYRAVPALIAFIAFFSPFSFAKDDSDQKFWSMGAEKNGVIAEVGKRKITVGELDQAAKDEFGDVLNQVYYIRKRQLDRMIEEEIWKTEAGKKKKSVEDFKADIAKSVNSAPSDSTLRDYYQLNVGNYTGTFESEIDKVRSNYIEREKKEAERNFIETAKKDSKVKILLEPIRAEIRSDESPSLGNERAPITFIEYSDFECPFCHRFQPTFNQIKAKYGDRIRFVFKNFPLPFHKKAEAAHLAALCAHDQGKFWEYRDRIFQPNSSLEPDELVKYAGELGLDKSTFDICLKDMRHLAKIKNDIAEGNKAGVDGTPAFLINGRLVTGAQSFETFDGVIREELSRAR